MSRKINNSIMGTASVIVLGIMQDAGLPHAGCRCRRCLTAFAEPGLVEYATSLGIVEWRNPKPGVWLIDATPDIKYQLNLLARPLGQHPTMPDRVNQPEGLFLTHAHMGHTAGLLHLGPEAMNVQSLPVYASQELVNVLRRTQLWQPLMANLKPITIEPGQAINLSSDLTITPFLVPHRDELGTGTFAYRIAGPNKTLFYMPDIDSWEVWPEAKEILENVAVSLVDATFFNTEELGGRHPVAHPTVLETLHFFDTLPGELWLTHINHTNPILDVDGDARRMVLSAGGHIARTGQIIPL